MSIGKSIKFTTKSTILSALFFAGTVLNKTNLQRLTPVLCLLALFLIWYEPRKIIWLDYKNMPLSAKIISTVTAVLFFISPLVFSHQQTILIYSILPLICAAAVVYYILKTKNTEKEPAKSVEWWAAVYALIFVELAGNSTHFTFINSAFVRFLPYAALLGILSGVCAVFVQHKPNKRTSEHIWTFISAALLLTLFFYFCAENLNYALDTVKPSEYTFEIVEKDRHRRRRGRTTYDFTFVADGEEINVKIPKSHYDAFDIGDMYPVRKYEGAFGEAFYISKAYVDP